MADQLPERRAEHSRHQRVYISGIRGQHSLEVGVAYYYRGHHIYSAAAANPIEPTPFSTRKGITVVGIAQHLAPLYAPQAPDLVPEASIRALDRARQGVLADMAAYEEARRAETRLALQEEADMKKSGTAAVVGTVTPHDHAQYLAVSAPASRPTSPSHAAISRGLLRPVASASRLSRMTADDGARRTFTPLAEVAEGRAHSSRTADDAVLDTEMVTNALLEWLDPEDVGASGRVISRPSSPAARCTQENREHEGVSLQALGQRETHGAELPLDNISRRTSQINLSHSTSSDTHPWNQPTVTAPHRTFGPRTASGPSAAFSSAHSSKTPTTVPNTPDNPLYLPGLGQTTLQPLPTTTRPHSSSLARPRAASIALNTAYNAANPRRPTFTLDDTSTREESTLDTTTAGTTETYVPKCPLHGAECDGESVTHVHQTEHARRGRGFRDLYPTITVGDRTIIDWARVMQQEKERMGQ
ncbi:hypothetical protein J1614_005939 [Plenodomus biglobosus]|nr:hypothetical protein J1614_005939 [Plenodomus biglobosus]